MNLRFQGKLPFHWQRLEAEPEAAERERLARDNERLLQLLPGVEPPPEPADEEGPLPRHLQHLELKLQLLTELLGELLARSHPLPPRRDVWFSTDQVGWHEAGDVPAIGMIVLAEPYLNESVPRPLRLIGQVRSVQEGEVVAELRHPGDGVLVQLDRLIFRHHRREIASRKSTP